MLDFLRKGTQSTAVKLLFAVIIIVFVFWGVGTFRAQRVDVLAKVNGEPITLNEYRALYQFRYQQLRQMFGDKLNEEFLKAIHFRQQVLEELIKRRLFEEAARRLKLTVTEEELRFAISQLPAFQEGGHFSFRRYRAVLRDMGLLPKDFEESVRADLLSARLKHFLTATIFAPETEVRERYAYENERLKLAYVERPYTACEKKVKIAPEELKAYYEKHRERYRSDERVKVVYYFFPYERYQKRISITEEELQSYYEAQKDRFFEPEKRKVRMIFIKAKPGKKREALSRAEALKEKIKGLKDFVKLARKFSDDKTTASLGGDLGYVKAGELFPTADTLVFAAKEGEVVGPIEHENGYYLFFIEKIRPAGTKPLAEVKETLKEELIKKRAREEAFSAADTLYEKAVLAGGLREAAQKEKLKLSETGFFSRQKPAKPFTRPEILETVFSLEEGELSSPIDTGKGVILFQVEKKEPSRILSLEEAKDRVKADLVKEKARELCRQEAEAFIKEVQKVKDPKSFFEKRGFQIFQRESRRKELLTSHLPEVIARAVAARAAPGIVPEPVCGSQACYIVWLESLKPADFSDWEKEKEILSHILTQEKREAYFQAWYRNLREKAEIKLYKELP